MDKIQKKDKKCSACKGIGKLYSLNTGVETLIICENCKGAGKILVKPTNKEITTIQPPQTGSGLLLAYSIWLFSLVFVCAIHIIMSK